MYVWTDGTKSMNIYIYVVISIGLMSNNKIIISKNICLEIKSNL